MIDAPASPAGISGKNRRLLTRLHREFPAPFTVREAAGALDFSIPQARRFLAYLTERGWLVRVHPGLYATVSLEAETPSDWREDPWVVAAKLFGPNCYLGGWTACEYWDLTDQIFRETVVFTTRRVRSTEIEVQDFPFRLRRVALERMFGTPAGVARPHQGAGNVGSDPHTWLTCWTNPPWAEEYATWRRSLASTFAASIVNDELLVDYMMKVGNGAVYKRLGYLLEELDIAAPGLLRECREGITAGISMLDPDLPRSGPATRRWNLRVNGNVN